MSHHDEFSSIAPSDLAEIAGGAPAASQSRSSTQVTAALQGITSQISSLNQSKTSSSSSIQSLLPMMMMLGKGGAAGGACPCGCGMANCMRR